MTSITLGLLLAILPPQAGAAAPVADYAGTYADEPGRPVEIVPLDGLFAVQDEAKYRLQIAGTDSFSTGTGQTLSFKRDASGKVTAYEQQGRLHPRISLSVSPAASGLAYARPPGSDTAASYHYHPPADLHDGIAVGDIAGTDLGVNTAKSIVSGILDGTWKDVHSVLLYQHGRLVFEEYFYGYAIDRPHQLRSATKSVVSLLAGIAIDHGSLSGADEKVIPAMSYKSYDYPDARKASITLGNFLSMSSGLDCNDHSADSPGRETVIDEQPDWVKATLDLPMINDPGSKGYYCSGGVAVVGRMTENAVHMPLPAYAQTNLFSPLGMKPGDWKWNYNLTNANKEYSQIHLRPRDMLKLGILYAQGGKWQGRQIVSSDWIAASLAEHSQVENTGYGYFWWRPWQNVQVPNGNQRVDMEAAQGNGGQKIYLLPQYDFVAVFTAGAYNAPNGAPPNQIMSKVILPPLIAAAAQSKATAPKK